jgi:hypothetical protein
MHHHTHRMASLAILSLLVFAVLSSAGCAALRDRGANTTDTIPGTTLAAASPDATPAPETTPAPATTYDVESYETIPEDEDFGDVI